VTVRHRIKQGGIAMCGAKERDGAKFTMRHADVTCEWCRKIVISQRTAAKAAFRAL